jgi:hypothetical protein
MKVSLMCVVRGTAAVIAAGMSSVACGAYEGEGDYDQDMTGAELGESVTDGLNEEIVEKKACFNGTLGGPTSCKSVATWTQYSPDKCVARGLTLTAYTPVVACGNGRYRYVRYTCC